jgi:hypothetical protein
MRVKLAAVLFLLCVGPAAGQTASDLEGKYGKPVNAYSVSEYIWMTPEYTADGQVCRMRLHPKHFSLDTNYLSKRLPFEELKVALNRLVPPNARGSKKGSFGISATGGGAAWTTYPYEKVTFTFTSSFKVDPDSQKEFKPYTFSVSQSSSDVKLEDNTPPDDDFSLSHVSSAEIVTIEWSDRKCLGK